MRPLAVALLAILVLGTEVVTAVLQVSLAMSASSGIAILLAAQLAEVLAVPFGAMAAVVAIERGRLRAAFIGGALLLLAAAVAAETATDTSPVAVPVGLAVGAATGSLLTAAFTALVHATSASWRSTGVALLVVVGLFVGAFGLIYTDGWIVIPAAAVLVLVATVLAAVIAPHDGAERTPRAIGPLLGFTVLLTMGIAGLVAAADPRRIIYGLVLPLGEIELADLTLGRSVVLAIGLLLVGIAGRALFARDGHRSLRLIACLALLAVGGAAMLVGSGLRASISAPGSVSFLAGNLGVVAGAVVAAWWMRGSASAAVPAAIGGGLIAAAALILVTNPPYESVLLLNAAMIAAGVGIGLVLVAIRTLVADIPVPDLGRITAGSVIAVSAATTVGSMLANTIATGVDLPIPLLDVAMLAAAIGGGILLAARLPARLVPGAHDSVPA